MNKKFKVLGLIALTALIVAMPVLAQDAPAELQSNTSRSTAGLFGTDVDDSMSVHGYSNVEFGAWAGFIGWGGELSNGNATGNPLSIGYATNVGALYLGAWYTGNVMAFNNTKTEIVTGNYDLNRQLQTNTVTSTQFEGFETTSNNQLEVLVGVADMGFKVGFWENMTVRQNPDRTVTVTEETNGNRITYDRDFDIDAYREYKGHLMPSLTWGMELSAGPLTIRPTAAFALDIFRDKRILSRFGVEDNSDPDNLFDTYTTINGNVEGLDRSTFVGHSRGYVAPIINVGAEVDLPFGSIFDMTAEVGYGINFRIFRNNYDPSGMNGRVNGEVNWTGSRQQVDTRWDRVITTELARLDFDEKTYFHHDINLGLTMVNEVSESFKFGIYTGIPFEITSASSDTYFKLHRTTTTEFNSGLSSAGRVVETEEFRPGRLENESTFAIKPVVNLGAVYQLFPGRFAINAGIGVKPLEFTRTVTTTTRNSHVSISNTKTSDLNGNVLSETISLLDEDRQATTLDSTENKVEVNREWERFGAEIWGGFMFNFNENAAIDLSAGAGTSPGRAAFNLDVFNLNVLFSMKF